MSRYIQTYISRTLRRLISCECADGDIDMVFHGHLQGPAGGIPSARAALLVLNKVDIMVEKTNYQMAEKVDAQMAGEMAL